MSTPDAPARVLALMGSGETSPTMVKVHREILESIPQPPRALLLDTPFGFQENRAELANKAQIYFRDSLHAQLDVATPEFDSQSLVDERTFVDYLLSRVQQAHYIFSGPGSPTYALNNWRDTVLAQLLREKLQRGGAVTFASAAALTLGAFTIPVYEIYKVGESPRWLEGLDVLRAAGLKVAVVPHYNNAEGGTHDTRYCYLGERRLRVLEDQLPDDAFVLGIDEHTSLVIDLITSKTTVGGIGTITIRKNGRSVSYETGAELSLDDILNTAFGRESSSNRTGGVQVETAFAPASEGGAGESPLLGVVRDAEDAYGQAIAAHDANKAVAAVLDLEQQIHDWSSDVPGQGEMDRARASLRSMVLQLGEQARDGLRDPRETLGPFIEALLLDRAKARDDKRFAEADEIRARLVELGVEIHDLPGKTEWEIAG